MTCLPFLDLVIGCGSPVGRVKRARELRFGLGYASKGEEFFVYDDEETFCACQDGAVGVLDFGLMEELAAWGAVGFCWTAEVAADEDERLVEGNGAELVDLHVASHGKDVERAVELAHGFVEEGGDDTAVDVARWALVHAVELEV